MPGHGRARGDQAAPVVPRVRLGRPRAQGGDASLRAGCASSPPLLPLCFFLSLCADSSPAARSRRKPTLMRRTSSRSCSSRTTRSRRASATRTSTSPSCRPTTALWSSSTSLRPPRGELARLDRASDELFVFLRAASSPTTTCGSLASRGSSSTRRARRPRTAFRRRARPSPRRRRRASQRSTRTPSASTSSPWPTSLPAARRR